MISLIDLLIVFCSYMQERLDSAVLWCSVSNKMSLRGRTQPSPLLVVCCRMTGALDSWGGFRDRCLEGSAVVVTSHLSHLPFIISALCLSSVGKKIWSSKQPHGLFWVTDWWIDWSDFVKWLERFFLTEGCFALCSKTRRAAGLHKASSHLRTLLLCFLSAGLC